MTDYDSTIRIKKSLVDALCTAGKSNSLEPPGDFFFLPLRQFLDGAHITALNWPLDAGALRVLLDEREDNESSTSNPRTWKFLDDGYLLRPNAGLISISKGLDLSSLYSTLSEKVNNVFIGSGAR